MDFNATIDLIIKDLDQAREIIEDLKKYPGVPALQVELAKSKCKSAGEVIALLKSQKDVIADITEPQPDLAAPTTFQAPAGVTAHQDFEPPPVVITPPVAITPSVVITPPIVVAPPEEIIKPEEKKEEIKKTPKKVSESTIIADKFNHLSSINEQLGGNKSDNDVTDFIKTKPWTSLSEVIGVNDKFLFIREIFDGDKEAYSQAISRLDNAGNLTDAKAVIMSYTGDNNENEAVKHLLHLLKRKLPSNE
jgi:hypothetical protein